jgi:hypothetical protein
VQLACASALYVQAMADPAHRSALLKESTALMNALAPDFKKLLYVQTWRQRIDASR